MTTTLNQLPDDILFEIMSNLALDGVVLSWVCRRFWSLAQGRTFWIHVLESIGGEGLLPCPMYTDIKGLELDRLRDLALHTWRLNENWSLPSPKLVRPIEHISFKGANSRMGHTEILFVVPGTEFLVTRTYRVDDQSSEIECWDISKKTAMCSLWLKSSHKYLDVGEFSEPYFEDNYCAIACQLREPPK